LFGEANSDDMNAVANITGGRAFDGRKAALAQVFKEIRGYQ
jgi:Ca-activated chloride channel family protein